VTDKPDTQELATYAAEIVGYEWLDIKPIVHDDEEEDGDLLDNISYKGWRRKLDKELIYGWNPAEDANQLDLIEAELLKLGLDIVEFKNPEILNRKYNYTIQIRGEGWTVVKKLKKYDIEQIRLCRLKAYVEAHRKLKENE